MSAAKIKTTTHHPVAFKLLKMLGFIVLALVILILLAVVIVKVNNYRSHHKLLSEVNRINLTSSKPQKIEYTSEPTDAVQIFSSSHPAIFLIYNIPLTNLGNERALLESKLGSSEYSVSYINDIPPGIVGDNKTYHILAEPEYNGQPISGNYITLSDSLPVNGLDVTLTNISQTNP